MSVIISPTLYLPVDCCVIVLYSFKTIRIHYLIIPILCSTTIHVGYLCKYMNNAACIDCGLA